VRTPNLLRVEDPVSAFQFLQLNGYPFFWSLEDLSACLLVRVLDENGWQIGLVWGEWKDTGLLMFHACAAPGHRLPWFGADLLDQLCNLAFFVGADEITTSITMARKIERLREENAVMSAELNFVTLDEYRALSHAYWPRGYSVKLAKVAIKICSTRGIKLTQQTRRIRTYGGIKERPVNVYPRHIIDEAMAHAGRPALAQF
jgi:hypothetical protein